MFAIILITDLRKDAVEQTVTVDSGQSVIVPKINRPDEEVNSMLVNVGDEPRE